MKLKLSGVKECLTFLEFKYQEQSKNYSLPYFQLRITIEDSTEVFKKPISIRAKYQEAKISRDLLIIDGVHFIHFLDTHFYSYLPKDTNTFASLLESCKI